jgi:hypothetical protein
MDSLSESVSFIRLNNDVPSSSHIKMRSDCISRNYTTKSLILWKQPFFDVQRKPFEMSESSKCILHINRVCFRSPKSSRSTKDDYYIMSSRMEIFTIRNLCLQIATRNVKKECADGTSLWLLHNLKIKRDETRAREDHIQ